LLRGGTDAMTYHGEEYLYMMDLLWGIAESLQQHLNSVKS